MSDTIREQIISAYLTRLASWTTTNGFNYSCGASVGRAVQDVEFDDLPACVLWPGIEEAESTPYGRTKLSMSVKLEALVEYGSTAASVAQEKLLGDAIKIMTDPAVSVSTKIDSIFYINGGPAGQNKPEEKTTAISAEFKINYETLVGNPYSQ